MELYSSDSYIYSRTLDRFEPRPLFSRKFQCWRCQGMFEYFQVYNYDRETWWDSYICKKCFSQSQAELKIDAEERKMDFIEN